MILFSNSNWTFWCLFEENSQWNRMINEMFSIWTKRNKEETYWSINSGQERFEDESYYRASRKDDDIGNWWIRFNEIAECETKEPEEEERETETERNTKKILTKRERGRGTDTVKERRREDKEKVRSHSLKSVLNHTSPVKVEFYELNCTSTSCLYTGVDRLWRENRRRRRRRRRRRWRRKWRRRSKQ